jgi:diguanylate cyclase (GGDEF)-like protein
MPIPIHYLIGSPRRLAIAITLFVILDLSVLVINLWIAEQVARDAVAINLAGRQRMLSQQITKSLLLINHAAEPAQRQAAREELALAYRLFATTLRAFDHGGVTTGGDGKQVELRQVTQIAGRKPLDAALQLVKPIAGRLDAFLQVQSKTEDLFRWEKDYMVSNNREILANMNRLTSALEHHSVRRIQELRAVQTGAFILAMVNFLVIVLGLVKQYHQVANAGHRWREAAQHDVLTGLFNRAALRDALDAGLVTAAQEHKLLAVLVLDLDGFKPINDHFGHAAGDIALQKVATALLHLARESDTVARLGGDEFALVCPNLHGDEHIRSFCDRIVAGISNVECIDGQSGCLKVSVGIALYPMHGSSVDELMTAADRAMYSSKHAGGNRWSLATLNR